MWSILWKFFESRHIIFVQHIFSTLTFYVEVEWFNACWSMIFFDMFVKYKCFTKFSCFCLDKILINSFTNISTIDTQLIFIRLAWTSWRNQWRCTSTCLSLMSSFNNTWFKIIVICWLSQRMINFFMKSNRIDSKNRLHQMIFLIARVRARSSISILDVMIVICLIVLQSIESSYNWKKYSFKLFLKFFSSMNAALFTIKNMFKNRSSKYSIARFFVSYKYEITRLIATKWSELKS
jgi:hypothetical protein